MATASPLARARRSTELSLVVMAGMITAIAYTFASLGQYTQIPARIIPFLLTLLGLLLLRPPRRALVRPRCRPDVAAPRRPAPWHRLRDDHPPRARSSRRVADDLEHHRHRRLRGHPRRRAAGGGPRPLSLDVPVHRRRSARAAARPRRRQLVRRRPHLGEHRTGQLPARRVRQDSPSPSSSPATSPTIASSSPAGRGRSARCISPSHGPSCRCWRRGRSPCW